MSDSGAKGEIEEVLSSVRRLVSTGDRLTPAGDAGAGAAKATPDEGDRLVLAPSLRIDTAERPTDDAAVQDEGARALKARIAELEEVVARQSDQWEPDNALGDANSGGPVAPLPWKDDITDEAGSDDDRTTRQSVPATESAPSDSAAAGRHDAAADKADGLLAKDGGKLDEDALRDLVADIVRQELQGALGERITRNVRKLVRREINRALDSQDL